MIQASKEECRRQIATASILTEMMNRQGDAIGQAACEKLMIFLVACEKRLPSEAALTKDKQRKRTKM
jgi:hypothetical protein